LLLVSQLLTISLIEKYLNCLKEQQFHLILHLVHQ
jgi:hypothetical protein